jgi:hypothetical protein
MTTGALLEIHMTPAARQHITQAPDVAEPRDGAQIVRQVRQKRLELIAFV